MKFKGKSKWPWTVTLSLRRWVIDLHSVLQKMNIWLGLMKKW